MLIRTSQNARRHAAEFLRYLRNFQFERTDDGGILLAKAKITAHGEYVHSVNGQDERTDPNLLPEQGLTEMLAVFYGVGTKPAAWYLAPYANNISPADGWTAANFTATASEIVSGTEGYSETTRQLFTPSAAASKQIDNVASKASFTIVTASTLTVRGAGLLTASAKGATTGVLGSATKFDSARVLNNGDDFDLGYRITLTST